MKILKYSLLICLVVMFTKCSPDHNGSFGGTVDRTIQLIGTWKIESVFQIDLDAEKKSFPEFATKVDITNTVTNMPFSDFEMTLHNNTISTTLGMSPMAYVIEEGQGTWNWISNDELSLVNQELGINASSGITTSINGKEVQLFISTFSGITAPTPTLSLNYKRIDEVGNDVMRYEYILVKQ
ncbi:DUF5004 domain-containing protein [Tenacibaculum adriaticum]|nr:DUF5004 domain-containing protein [Tenacibaculum adriaticum]